MEFYESIAKYYDDIFPYKHKQLEFIEKSIVGIGESVVLEIGAGTGNLTKSLKKRVGKLCAIDLDEDLIKIAELKSIKIEKMNMLEIEKNYELEIFDLIVSLGNTLVHLKDRDEILEFLKKTKNLLKKEGTLIIQIINYNRIIDQKIDSLAVIENSKIKFIRNYNYNLNKNSMDFVTKLYVKEEEKMIINCIKLYPLRQEEIQDLLKKSDYKEIEFYGDFNGGKYTKDSVALVVKAK